MRTILILCFFCLPNLCIGQVSSIENVDTKTEILNWLKDLNEKGVEITEDSIKVSKEYLKVRDDAAYRAIVYPSRYTWEQTSEFLKNQELKLAFWYMINLYPMNDKNKDMVVKSFVMYDKLFKMDEILVGVFYTYCFIDPEINTITNGIPEVRRPDILESKLRHVDEIINYMNYFRENHPN